MRCGNGVLQPEAVRTRYPYAEECPLGSPGLNNSDARESDVYVQHRRAAIERHLRRVLRLIDDSLDFMIEVAGAPLHCDDARTISSIAGRIFEHDRGALREALNGYPRTYVPIAAGFDRDPHAARRVLSRSDANSALAGCDERRTARRVSPAKLPKVLEERDGAEIARLRKRDYQMFSEHAAHLHERAPLLSAAIQARHRWGPGAAFCCR